MFQLTHGFDICIGNPPYVRQEEIKHLKPKLQFYECYTGTSDLYVYFYERAIRLLKPGGVFAFITSNKWYRAKYGEKLRGWMTRNTRLRQILDFGDAAVFDAIAYPTIVIATRRPGEVAVIPPAEEFLALNWTRTDKEDIERFPAIFAAESFPMAPAKLSRDGWCLESQDLLRLLEKLQQVGKPLREVVGSRVFRGITTGFNQAFIVDRATRDRLVREHKSSNEVLKPYLRGRDVNRWSAESQDQWIIFVRRGTDIGKYPAIQKHLSQFKKRLSPGKPGGRKPGSYEWYEIQDNTAYWQELEKTKIVSTKISIRPTFAIDSNGYYLGNTSYFFSAVNAGHFLLGLLNSSLFFLYAKKVFVEKQGGWFEVQPDALESFPIPAPSPAQQKSMEALVQRILDAKQEGGTGNPACDSEKNTDRNVCVTQITHLEREIDELVYGLYGLTAAEIALVEAGVGR